MIRLGLSDDAKRGEIACYVAANDIRHVVVFSPARFRLAVMDVSHEHVEWAEIIRYTFYYRLLQEVDRRTLLVINECLRTKNRHDLTYNCLRNYLNQTPHQIVFQYLPIIDSFDDFAVLFDFDTRSRWKREAIGRERLVESDMRADEVPLTLSSIAVKTDAKTKADYARAKRRLIDGLGLKDPHTIPRNLHLLSGKAKLAAIEPDGRYVGRNNRFGLAGMATYREVADAGPRTVFEFCHNAIDFADFLAVSRQAHVSALVSDLRVDGWYFTRYQAWAERLRDAYAVLRR